MKKIFLIGKYTFLEAIKSRLLLNVLFLGVGLLITSYIASELTYGVPEKISLDMGLGLISLTSKVIALFYGVGILQNEIENRTIYLIISRPVSKIQYFLGRISGMSLILLLNIILLGPFSLGLFYFLGGKITSLMVWTLFFTFVESFLLLLIVVVCSLFCSKVLSILFGISSYILGYVTSSLLSSNPFAKEGLFNVVLKISSFILPNFSRLNLKDYVMYEQELDANILFSSLVHAGFYATALLILGSLLMKSKSLD